MNTRLISAASALALVLAAPVLAAAPVVVHVSVPDTLVIAQRGKGTAHVKLAIDAGYHVQANPASADYLIPTALKLKAPRGLKVSRAVYPKGTPYSLEGTTEKLSTYEGSVEVNVPLRATDEARPGSYTLHGTLRAQACDARACYAPADFPVDIVVRVEKRQR